MSWWCHFLSLVPPLLLVRPLIKASVLQHVAASLRLCTNNIQEHLEGSSFNCGTNIQFNTRMNWWDVGRPTSRWLGLYKADVLPCEHDISVTPPGNPCKVGTNVLSDTKTNWFDPFTFGTNVPFNSRINSSDLVVKGRGFKFLASWTSQVWISSNFDQLSPRMRN